MKKLLLAILFIVGCDIFKEDEHTCCKVKKQYSYIHDRADCMPLAQLFSGTASYDDVDRNSCMLMNEMPSITYIAHCQMSVSKTATFHEQECSDDL